MYTRPTLIINDDATEAEKDSAYDAMTEEYKGFVRAYCKIGGIQVRDLVQKAGCPHPEVMLNFLDNGNLVPTGKDLELLLSHIGLQQRFAEDVPVKFIPESTDKISNIIGKISWFYMESARRAITQEDQGLQTL